MAGHVNYRAWCPCSGDCLPEMRCGKCPVIRRSYFKRAKLAYENKRDQVRRLKAAGAANERHARVETEQRMILDNPRLYADNIDAKTNAADLADPIPRWVTKIKHGYGDDRTGNSALSDF